MPQENPNDRKHNDHAEKLRAEASALLEQARNQLAAVQKALSALAGDSAAHARLAGEADRLSAIVSQLSQAVNSSVFPLRGTDLAAIGSLVQSSGAQAALAQTASTSTKASAAVIANVATTSAETRTETESLARDVFDRHVFDRYLHYRSAEDEEESRRRQAEDQKYIAAQLARKTPEGDLNASGGMIDSMLDLHTHGAGNSPEFTPRWNSLVAKAQHQHDAMRAAGQSTAEYDGHVMSSVKRFLKNEGKLSDAEVEHRLSGAVNPLDAVKPYLNKTQDGGPAKPKDQRADAMEGAAADLGERLKSAGVRVSDSTEVKPAHGVTVQKSLDDKSAVLGG